MTRHALTGGDSRALSQARTSLLPSGARHAILSTYALTLVPSYDDVVHRGAEALVPGGLLVVIDIKAPRWWPKPVLRAIVLLFRPFGVTLDLRARHPWSPWESLAKHLNLVVMEERCVGTTYIAAGEKPAAAPTIKGEARPLTGSRYLVESAALAPSEARVVEPRATIIPCFGAPFIGGAS